VASVNTSSIREEIAKVEQEIERLSRAGKVSDETRMLFNTLLMIANMLVAIFIEKSTRKNSKNSSLPPSQIGTDESAKPARGQSKRRSEKDEPFDNSRAVETCDTDEVTRCDHCCENLSKVSVMDVERRTRIDIIFEKRIEHIDAQIKRCPLCQQITKAAFPSNLAGPVQYGPGIKAYVLNLLITQMVSLSRIQKLLKTLIGRAISEATLVKYIPQLHQALEA